MVLKEAFSGHGNMLSFFLFPLLSVSVDGRDLHVKRKGTGLLRPACGPFFVFFFVSYVIACSDSVPHGSNHPSTNIGGEGCAKRRRPLYIENICIEGHRTVQGVFRN